MMSSREFAVKRHYQLMQSRQFHMCFIHRPLHGEGLDFHFEYHRRSRWLLHALKRKARICLPKYHRRSRGIVYTQPKKEGSNLSSEIPSTESVDCSNPAGKCSKP